MPAAAQRSPMSPVRQRFTLRAWVLALSIVDWYVILRAPTRCPSDQGRCVEDTVIDEAGEAGRASSARLGLKPKSNTGDDLRGQCPGAETRRSRTTLHRLSLPRNGQAPHLPGRAVVMWLSARPPTQQ